MYISIRYQDENKIASECRIFNCRVRREATWEEAREFGFFDRNSSLSRLGVVHHTDKNQYFHNYLDKYDFVLSKIRNESFTMIELGVFKGESMRMWHEYFPSATIVGVDIDKDAKQYENRNENMIVEVMDISKPENLNKLKQSYVPRFILDDASHIWSHQILALSTLYPCLPSGGIYIIEDLETSVMNGCMKKYGDINVTAMQFCSRIARIVASKIPEKFGQFSDSINEIGMATELVMAMKGSYVFIKQ